MADGLVGSGADLEALLAAHHRLSLARGDAVLVRLAWRAVACRDEAALRAVAERELAARPAATQREAALALGGGLLRAARAASLEDESARLERVSEALAGRAPRATVFGAVAHAFGASEEGAGEAYAYAVLAGMTGAAVRLGRIGAAEAQAILRRVCAAGLGTATALEQPASSGESDPAWLSPLLDIAAMRHESLEPRLFAS